MPSKPTPAPTITLMSVVGVALNGNNLVVRPLLFTIPIAVEAFARWLKWREGHQADSGGNLRVGQPSSG